MRIDKVNWITAHNYGKPKWHSVSTSLRWKQKIWGLNIVSQNVPQNTNYSTKIADLGIIFKVTSYTDTSYCIQILWELGKYAIPFCFFAHPVHVY